MNTLPLQDLKILVVDDDRDSREMMIVALESEGAEVKAAESARSAFSVLVDWQPDLLVSDIRMPDADGYSFLQTVRSQSLVLPAIAVTAFAGDDDRIAAISAGFQCHLSKPIDLELLYDTIVKLMQQPAL